jgi:transposase-like protein
MSCAGAGLAQGHVASRRSVHQDCGKTHYLWRAVDRAGNVLDILVTSRRDAKAATRSLPTPRTSRPTSVTPKATARAISRWTRVRGPEPPRSPPQAQPRPGANPPG